MRACVLELQKGLRGLDEAWAENGVSEIGAGLLERGEGEVLRGRAGAETGYLREDEPDPVTRLPAGL